MNRMYTQLMFYYLKLSPKTFSILPKTISTLEFWEFILHNLIEERICITLKYYRKTNPK